MKKIAFNLNTCICMVLFLPVLDCVEWLCTVHVCRGMKRVLCFLKVFKRRIEDDQLLRNVPSNSYRSLQSSCNKRPQSSSLSHVTHVIVRLSAIVKSSQISWSSLP